MQIIHKTKSLSWNGASVETVARGQMGESGHGPRATDSAHCVGLIDWLIDRLAKRYGVHVSNAITLCPHHSTSRATLCSLLGILSFFPELSWCSMYCARVELLLLCFLFDAWESASKNRDKLRCRSEWKEKMHATKINRHTKKTWKTFYPSPEKPTGSWEKKKFFTLKPWYRS